MQSVYQRKSASKILWLATYIRLVFGEVRSPDALPTVYQPYTGLTCQKSTRCSYPEHLKLAARGPALDLNDFARFNGYVNGAQPGRIFRRIERVRYLPLGSLVAENCDRQHCLGS
jgi:hypothetical protein